MRYWISWYTAEEDPDNLPFEAWITGERVNADFSTHSVSMVAVIDAESEQAAYNLAREYYPDLEERFCNQVADDFEPGSRFPKYDSDHHDDTSS